MHNISTEECGMFIDNICNLFSSDKCTIEDLKLQSQMYGHDFCYCNDIAIDLNNLVKLAKITKSFKINLDNNIVYEQMEEILLSMSLQFKYRNFHSKGVINKNNHWDNFVREKFGIIFLNLRVSNNRIPDK